jgi:hypothetical protein
LLSACDVAGVISVPFVEGASGVGGGRCRVRRQSSFWPNEPKKLNDFNTNLITV